MNVGFATERLREVCESRGAPRTRAPASVVEQLHARLADMRAATCVADLVVARAEIDSQPPGRVWFRLDEGYELVCVGSVAQPYLDAEGLVDLNRMRRVIVTKFGRSSHG